MLKIQTISAGTFVSADSEPTVPADDELLLQIAYVGICGSDLQIFHGLHKTARFPLVQGHEVSAVVCGVGKQVTGFKVGDCVVPFPLKVCGNCFPCEAEAYNVCENQSFLGVGEDGMFAQYITLPEQLAIPIPEGMEMSTAALVEPAAVGVHAARRGQLQKGTRVVVIGAGPIGNFTAQACKAFGATVLLCDISDEKLQFAQSKGIQHTGNTQEAPLKASIASAFEGRPAQVIYDCVGLTATLSSAIEASANASKIVVVGNFKEPFPLEISALQRREVDLIGSFLYKKDDFIQAIQWLQEGRINVEGMVSGIYSLDALPDAFQYIEENPAKVFKLLIKPE